MSGGRERYDGYCVYCLAETAMPTTLHDAWPNHYGSNPYRAGIVWTCIICGEEMFWSIKKATTSICMQFEWIHWEVQGMGPDAPMDSWNKNQKAVLLQGIWFQKRKIGWRFGESWSSIKGINYENLPKYRH